MARSEDETVSPLDAASWAASVLLTWLCRTASAKPMSNVPVPPAPVVSISEPDSASRRHWPAWVLSSTWSWVFSVLVAMVVPLMVAA